MNKKAYASIDLGTNSCRLLITDEQGRKLQMETKSVRLGEGLYENMRFTNEAIERAQNCFFNFKQVLDRYNVVKFRAIATAACRMAENGAELLKQIYDETKIKIEVVDGLEEARLNLVGAMSHVLGKSKYVLIYDLGGGSTEITLATNEITPKILHSVSIPWGARNASEAFDLIEYSNEKAEKLREVIAKYVQDFCKISNLQDYVSDIAYVATSSTPLRLVCMVREFGKYDRDWADGRFLDCEKTSIAIENLFNSSRDDLAKNPYIGDKRSYIFIAASVIFETIFKELGIKTMITSLKSAKDGIIEEFVNEVNNDKN